KLSSSATAINCRSCLISISVTSHVSYALIAIANHAFAKQYWLCLDSHEYDAVERETLFKFESHCYQATAQHIMTATIATHDRPSFIDSVSEGERETRLKLAAVYREFGRLGWSKLIFNHITARVPGSDHFLINPFGLLYEEVSASNLIKVDFDGVAVDE